MGTLCPSIYCSECIICFVLFWVVLLRANVQMNRQFCPHRQNVPRQNTPIEWSTVEWYLTWYPGVCFTRLCCLGLFRGIYYLYISFNSWGYSTKDASMAQWSIFAVLSSVPLWCLVLFCTGKIKRRVGWSWLCDLDPYSNSASLRCTRIRFMAFQANDLDLYTGSHQTRLCI